MGSKLKEVTFGTPIVLKVNNTAPDANGNVTVQTGVTGIESTASGVKKITADSSCGMTFCGYEYHCGGETHYGCEYHNGGVTFSNCGYENHYGSEEHNGNETHCGTEFHYGYEEHCGDVSFGSGTVTFTDCGGGGFVIFGGGCACAGDGYGNANITVTAIAFRGPNGEIKVIDYDKVKNL